MSAPLRVGVLTTDTAHHRWFVREVAARTRGTVEIAAVVFETRAYPWAAKAQRYAQEHRRHPLRRRHNPYLPSAALDRAAAAYEEPRFFPDGDRSLPASTAVTVVESVNDPEAVAVLDDVEADLLFVYGTGIVRPEVFERPRLGTVNAHGGRLPHYRGLDTNLWAALRGHPEDMAVTLHRMDATLDTGEVLAEAFLGPRPGLGLASLRYETTLVCTDLAVDLLTALAVGPVASAPQEGPGEYFGPMAPALKRRAERRIRRWVAGAAR